VQTETKTVAVQEVAQPLREGHRPLAYGQLWEDVPDHVGGGRGHATGAARRANPAALAGEADPEIVTARDHRNGSFVEAAPKGRSCVLRRHVNEACADQNEPSSQTVRPSQRFRERALERGRQLTLRRVQGLWLELEFDGCPLETAHLRLRFQNRSGQRLVCIRHCAERAAQLLADRRGERLQL